MLGALARPRNFASIAWTPFDSRFYGDGSAFGRSDAGVQVNADSAIKVAVVYRATTVRAQAFAMVPLVVYKLLDDEGKEKAKKHPAYNTLHDRPNVYQTSYRWRFNAMVQKILWGKHISEIVFDANGMQLVPLPPQTTRIVDQKSDGRLVYETRPVRGFGKARYLMQDEVVHFQGLSMDGFDGLPLTVAAKNAIGLSLAAEKHGSVFLRKGARWQGVLSTESKMDPTAREANESAWQRAFGGVEGAGGTPILTGGMKYTPISGDNRASQWVEGRTFQVEEILRFIGVPGVLCGYADKTATFASAEQFFQSFVTHTVQPDATEAEQELNAKVITDSPTYFASFLLNALIRGDIITRYNAHRIAIMTGFETRNEARVIEDMNKGPANLDEFLTPLNMAEGDGNNNTSPTPSKKKDPNATDANTNDGNADENALARVSVLERRAAVRLVTEEVLAIAGDPRRRTKGAAKKFAGDAEGWTAFLAEFYEDHAMRIAAELGLSLELAREYTDAQQARLADLATMPAKDVFSRASCEALLAIASGALLA